MMERDAVYKLAERMEELPHRYTRLFRDHVDSICMVDLTEDEACEIANALRSGLQNSNI